MVNKRKKNDDSSTPLRIPLDKVVHFVIQKCLEIEILLLCAYNNYLILCVGMFYLMLLGDTHCPIVTTIMRSISGVVVQVAAIGHWYFSIS